MKPHVTHDEPGAPAPPEADDTAHATGAMKALFLAAIAVGYIGRAARWSR